MKVYKKIISAVLTVFVLSGCSGNSPSDAEQDYDTGNGAAVSETAAESPETSAVSETMEETTVSETEKPPAEKKSDHEHPIVTPADQVYGIYPTKITYPTKQDTSITAEKAEIKETIYQGDIPIVEFEAEYPVFSGGDETVIKKINDSIKSYIDGVLDEERLDAEVFETNEEFNDHIMSVFGFYWQRHLYAGDWSGYKSDCYDVNGNILSVYFMDYTYGAGAAHGYETPVPMVFDLRTGDRIDFNDIVELKEDFAWKVHETLYIYLDSGSVESFEESFLGWYETGHEKFDELYTRSEDDRMDFYNGRMVIDDVIGYNDADSRLIVRDGCIGYYLGPDEYGPYAAGIRRIDIPVNDILPYLNEDGKALFEGFQSAESEPVKVIEFRGERYFSTNSVPAFWEVSISDKDYELISCFDDTDVRFIECRNIDYGRLAEIDCIKTLYINNSGDIDYDKLAEMDSINDLILSGYDSIDLSAIAKMKGLEELTLYGCEFDDISPLYGSGVKYIYGDSHVITKSQAEEFLNSGGEYVSEELIIRE